MIYEIVFSQSTAELVWKVTGTPNPENSGTMKLYIKYMVSLRCKMMVKEELKTLGLNYVIVDLGMVEILEEITETQRKQLRENLLSRAWNSWTIKKVS